MKSLIKIIIAMTIAIETPMAIAGPMDGAREQVEQSLALARATASGLVAMDQELAFQKALSKLNTLSNPQSLASAILVEQKSLESQFGDIANIDLNKISNLRELTLKTYNDYKANIRKRFDLSFSSAETRQNFRDALHLSQRALLGFEEMCKVGHSSIEFNTSAQFIQQMPKPEYYIKVIYNSGGDGQTPSHAEVGGNATGSKEETDLNKGSAAGLEIASVAYSAAFNAASTSVAAAYATAGAWSLGVGVALGVAAFAISKHKEVEMENEIADANQYLLQRIASDRDVAGAYREICKTESSMIHEVATALNRFETDPDYAKKVVQEAADSKTKIDDWVQSLARLSDLSLIGSRTDDQQNEFLDLKKKVAELTNAELITQYLITAFQSQLNSLNQNFSEIAWDAVDRAQARAFQKLSRLIHLLQQQLNSKVWSEESTLMKELKIEARFIELQSKYKDLLALEIREVFGRETAIKVRTAEADLLKQTNEFYKKYAHISAVNDLYMATTKLVAQTKP